MNCLWNKRSYLISLDGKIKSVAMSWANLGQLLILGFKFSWSVSAWYTLFEHRAFLSDWIWHFYGNRWEWTFYESAKNHR